MTTQDTSRRLIFPDEVYSLIRYSAQHLRRLEDQGDFPRRIRIGANRIAWSRAAVEQWVSERMGAQG
jgi:prophage regulatory protein